MFVVIKKSRLIIAIIILIAIIGITVGACVGVKTAKTAINATERKIPVYSVDTVEKKIALSFDAAWGDVILRRRSDQTKKHRRPHLRTAVFF